MYEYLTLCRSNDGIGWAYLTNEEYKEFDRKANLINIFNFLGKHGWKLVSRSDKRDEYYFIKEPK